MSRKLAIILFLGLLVIVPASLAWQSNEQPPETTLASGPSSNADLPVPDFSDRPDVPPGFGGDSGLVRYQDRAPEGVDKSAIDRWVRYAETVDQVLYELMQQGRTDFVVGIDAWGAPTFQAESDATAAAILNVFPPDIRDQVEILRAPQPTPVPLSPTNP